jgi:hypothetical protein
VFAALGVREVGAVVLVDGQAQTALEAADMVLKEVGVFIEVDRLQGEPSETFSSVRIGGGLRCDTTTAELGTCSILHLRVSPASWGKGEEFGLPDNPSRLLFVKVCELTSSPTESDIAVEFGVRRMCLGGDSRQNNGRAITGFQFSLVEYVGLRSRPLRSVRSLVDIQRPNYTQ